MNGREALSASYDTFDRVRIIGLSLVDKAVKSLTSGFAATQQFSEGLNSTSTDTQGCVMTNPSTWLRAFELSVSKHPLRLA